MGNIFNYFSYSQIVSEDECVIFEAPWEDILRSLKCDPNHNITIYEPLSIMRNLYIFSELSEWKLFQIAEMLKTVHFKNEEIIIKEGQFSEKLYILKSGTIHVFINDIYIKQLEKNECFGDFTYSRRSTRPAIFIAKGRVECWMLVKEYFQEIIGSSQKKPNPNMILLKDLKSINLEKLYYIKDLGQGSFGKVFQVHDGTNFYAVKVAEIKILNKNNLFKYFINEKNIMSSIDHPFIVRLLNTFKTKEHVFFLMEHIDGFTLKHYLDNRNRIKSRDIYEVQFFGAILLTIANYLQRIRVIHRDIKPSNLMIETSGYLKMIDFGVSKDMIGKDHTTTVIGTSHYMPPEMILGKGYSFSADYWTIGVVLYEIFYGCLPFGNNSIGQYEVYDEISNKYLFIYFY
jgi:cGMP-dependent protein kinase